MLKTLYEGFIYHFLKTFRCSVW